jgi:hypothetical protein
MSLRHLRPVSSNIGVWPFSARSFRHHKLEIARDVAASEEWFVTRTLRAFFGHAERNLLNEFFPTRVPSHLL